MSSRQADLVLAQPIDAQEVGFESHHLHNLFVRLAFGLLLVFVVCLTTVQIQNAAPRSWIIANGAYLVVLTAYVLVLFAGPRLATDSGLRFQVTAQKIIVYSSILNLSLQAWAVAQNEPRYRWDRTARSRRPARRA